MKPTLRQSMFCLLLILITSTPLTRAADAPDPGTAKPGWELVWQDEFNGKNPDLDKGWESQNGPSGHILSSRWRENVVEGNGLCRLLYKKENRAGQEYTSGNLWTRRQFQYGYFECRYRYGAATGLNNSFWLMSWPHKKGQEGQFEIDINEGHSPNEINATIHNWGPKHLATHRAYAIGSSWYHGFELKQPVKTDKLRLVAHQEGPALVSEIMVYPAGAASYPAAPADLAGKLGKTALPNLALGAKASASSVINTVHPVKTAIDGDLDTNWMSVREGAEHALTLDFGKPVEIGCVQVIGGRKVKGVLSEVMMNFELQAWNGKEWRTIPEAVVKPPDFGREFHVIGLEWNDKELVWFCDGKELRREKNEWCHGPAPIFLSGAVIKWGGKLVPEIDGTSMDVDYVRVYRKQGEAAPAQATQGTASPAATEVQSSYADENGKQPGARNSQEAGKAADDLDLSAMLRPAPRTAKFTDPGYQVWCGSLVRGEDQKYHLFYSRWPAALPFNAWVTHSEVAHAIGDSPLGPFKFVDVALPVRGKQFWDGLCTHNPTIYKFGDKYYLYYMGNTGDGKVMKSLNWLHRNNQRVGVAVAASPNGPWRRFDKPLIDVSPDTAAADSLCMANPAVAEGPGGKFIFIYKAVGRKSPLPFGGPVVHMVATGDSPTGPVKKTGRIIFTRPGEHFAAEDSFAWYDAGRGRYYAVAKDNNGIFTGIGECSLALFTSLDGLDWQPARHPLVSRRQIQWADGTTEQVPRLERPQLLFENGRPAVLLCAVGDKQKRSFNVQIPLAGDQ